MRVAIGLVALLAAACGDDTPGTDAGGGTKTLYVRARVELGGTSAALTARVQRAGVDVTDATVDFDSSVGPVTLVHQGGDEYASAQVNLSHWYYVKVTSGTDWLDGSIEAPEAPVITAPSTATAIDAHAAATVHVTWGGALAQQVKVKTKDFDWEGADSGAIDIPGASFKETSQEIEISRTNSTPLAGGAPSGDNLSQLTATSDSKATFVVVNPY